MGLIEAGCIGKTRLNAYSIALFRSKVFSFMIIVYNNLTNPDAALGVVRAEGLEVGVYPEGFEASLHALLGDRKAPLDDEEDEVRKAARDLLRNGCYKPTGRGKPASEYLIRAARQDEEHFPRINAPVDIANYISLKYLLPVSLWDLDLSGTDRFLFRLGQAEESYVFNPGGQSIALQDLIVGCRIPEDTAQDATPIVNPVKDSMATKTTDGTTRVAACVYTPLRVCPPDRLEAFCASFADLLGGCGSAVDTTYGVVLAGTEQII